MNEKIKHKLSRPLTAQEERRCEVSLSTLEAFWGYELELMVLASRNNPKDIYGFQFGRRR